MAYELSGQTSGKGTLGNTFYYPLEMMNKNGTVHEVVAHELRSRDLVNISINSLVDCASESNRAHVIV